MPVETAPTAALVLLLAFVTVACPVQSPYTLRFADGREVPDMKGVRGCLDAFNKNVGMKTGGYEAVCVPADVRGSRILRVRPVEKTPLGKDSGIPENGPLSGKLATQLVDWDSLPPWARGSFYTLRSVL